MNDELMRQRIRERLDALGLSINEASRRAGGSVGMIRDILSGKTSSPRVSTIETVARVLGVSSEYLIGAIDTHHPVKTVAPVETAPVVGKVAAGVWMEADDLDEPLGEITVVRDSRFTNHNHVAWEVNGDSMDQIAPDGSYAVAIPWAETGLAPRDGMIVVAERVTAGGQLRERTIKRLRHIAGEWLLQPLSDNPKHKPIRMSGEEVNLLGLVVQVTQRVDF